MIIKQVAWYKSSLLLPIQIQKTHTLQPFKKIIKAESILKSYLKCQVGWGFRDQVV